MTRAIFLSALHGSEPGGPARRLLDRLAREYRIVILPAPGEGPSGQRKPWSLGEIAASTDIELSASWLVAANESEASVLAGEPGRLKGVVATGGRGSSAALRRALLSIEKALIRCKVFVDFDTAREMCDKLRGKGKKIVFTNGIFDLFHLGHLRLIQSARELGDALVVGLNSDESARGLKGHTRPIIPQFARAEIVAALAAVDLCLIFPQPDPRVLLRAVRPDVLVKGSEYTLSRVVGGRFVRSYGGKVALVPHLEGYSTTAIAAGIAGVSRA